VNEQSIKREGWGAFQFYNFSNVYVVVDDSKLLKMFSFVFHFSDKSITINCECIFYVFAFAEPVGNKPSVYL